ncbi:tRNA pseudouridine(55) synthase TruB [Alloscardovia theropitheci]|uniref:tRNA pseudouridine synthase B n=1 Tax=Alloscardovia theropitheci TaxID=2496842 RepID=A0A4R0QTR8_9BIFI|nr:tRNA pseudouridine(55) synthase TruB [Alloscardovia theropitheci]TCD54938.1 tRNA pseudouridine(55) synthase TruB [Alloscardovia theropitheci]
MLTSGIIVVDKPQGVTSHDVVAACRGLLHTSKVGHAGTLDPMATGVLVIGFGSATRLLNSIVGKDKTYDTTIRLGANTTTDDADGDIIPYSEHEQEKIITRLAQLSEDDIKLAISRNLTGYISQIPSTFSAKKVDGQRAYDLARRGEKVELKPNAITVNEFIVRNIVRSDDGLFVDVDATITCSSGTYIRALGRDLGSLLNVGGHLTMLRRTRVGKFSVNDEKVIPFSAVEHSFTNKDGLTITRLKAVAPQSLATRSLTTQSLTPQSTTTQSTHGHENLEELEKHVWTPREAAQIILPTMELTPHQAIDISFGRPLKVDIHDVTAAIYQNDLMALLEPWRKHMAKPSTVFITPAELTTLVENL